MLPLGLLNFKHNSNRSVRITTDTLVWGNNANNVVMFVFHFKLWNGFRRIKIGNGCISVTFIMFWCQACDQNPKCVRIKHNRLIAEDQ